MQEEDLIPIEVSAVLNRKSAAGAEEVTRVLAVWSRPWRRQVSSHVHKVHVTINKQGPASNGVPYLCIVSTEPTFMGFVLSC